MTTEPRTPSPVPEESLEDEEAEAPSFSSQSSQSGGHKRRRRRIASDDEEDEEKKEKAEHEAPSQEPTVRATRRSIRARPNPPSPSASLPPPLSPPANAPTSPPRRSARATRYSLRSPSSTHARLSHVDEVLDSLKRQRRNEEGRAWLHQPGPDNDQADTDVSYDHDQPEDEDELDEEEAELRRLRGDDRSRPIASLPQRARTRRTSSRRREEKEEMEDGEDDEGWIVNESELEEEGEAGGTEDAISHMQLHHRMQLASEGLDDDDDLLDTQGLSTARGVTSALFPSLPLAAPLDLPAAFRLYVQYLAAVLLDGDASAWVESLPSPRRLMAAARQKVEESFNTEMSRWVRSQLWEQSTRSTTFLPKLEQLAYASSTHLHPADAIDPETGMRFALAPTCAACGKLHELTHTINLYGIPYQADQLQHPFDPDLIFPDGFSYRSAEFRVGELCHMRVRLYHAMRHFKSELASHGPSGTAQARPGDLEFNTRLVRDMFARETLAGDTSASLNTNTFLHRHQSVHDRLSSYAARYVAPDTRRVRIDTQELDELHDVDNEACASKLFDLRPAPAQPRASEAEAKSASEEVKAAEVKEDEGEVETDEILQPRRLMLDALARRVTNAELRYLYSLLTPALRRAWKECTRE